MRWWTQLMKANEPVDFLAALVIVLAVWVTLALARHYGARALKAVPQWLREAVEAQPRTRFDRAHFKEYGDSALVFEIVYCVLDRDYNLHMDLQQAINLAIFERFAREGVGFAYPTRTLHVYTAPGAATQ
jgi:small-conductance mechanosensitive channel